MFYDAFRELSVLSLDWGYHILWFCLLLAVCFTICEPRKIPREAAVKPVGVSPRAAGHFLVQVFRGIPSHLKVWVRVSDHLQSSKIGKSEHCSDRTNPTIGLCQRLAVFTIKNGKICEYRKTESKKRLDLMIGRYLPKRARRRLMNLSSSRFKKLECMWQALGQTVILNPEFDPDRTDYELIQSIQRFKLWFLKVSLSSDDFNRETGKLGKDLKTMSSWCMWYALNNPRNMKPRLLPRFPGYTKGAEPTFSWFGGHLSAFRNMHCGRLDQMQIKVMCQIRTFGRALPVPPKFMVEEVCHETLELLTAWRDVPPEVLRDIRCAMSYLNTRLDFGSLPYNSKVSVSTSGSLDRTQDEGGMAADAAERLRPLLGRAEDIVFREDLSGPETKVFLSGVAMLNITKKSFMHDCYGNRILTSGSEAPFIKGLRAVDVLYHRCSQMVDAQNMRNSIPEFKNSFGSNAGQVLIALSSGELMTYGHFTTKPDGYLSIGDSIPIPVWFDPTKVEFQPDNPIPTRLMGLAEPGFKVRPLTKGPMSLIIVLKSMRQMVRSILEKDGRLRVGISMSNKLWAFLKHLKDRTFPRKVFGQSSDYCQATDYIPLDVIEAIWTSFTSYLPVNHPFRVFHKLLWSPRTILVETGNKDARVTSHHLQQCGSFMGEPMSYMTLTLMNLLTEVISQKYYDFGKNAFSGLTDDEWAKDLRMDPFVIAGDDKLALRFCKARAAISREVSVGLGFVMSDKDGDSSDLMIFCEDHIILDRENPRKVKLTFIDVIKGRLLTDVHRGHSDNRASIFGKGRMLSTQLEWISDNVKRYVLQLHINLFARTYGGDFLRTRIPWFFPPNMGGLGLEPVDIPEWGYKYINYVHEVLMIEDWRTRMTLLWELRSLSSRPHKGVIPRPIALERASEALAHIKPATIDFDSSRHDLIFSDEQIINTMVTKGVSPLELTNSINHERVVIYAENNGFTQVNDLIDQFERLDAFQQLLEEPSKPTRRTAKMWQRRSSRFWKKKRIADSLKPFDGFKSIAQMERNVNHHFHGFCSKTLQDELLKNGPTLVIPSVPKAQRKFNSISRKIDDLFANMQRLPMAPRP